MSKSSTSAVKYKKINRSPVIGRHRFRSNSRSRSSKHLQHKSDYSSSDDEFSSTPRRSSSSNSYSDDDNYHKNKKDYEYVPKRKRDCERVSRSRSRDYCKGTKHYHHRSRSRHESEYTTDEERKSRKRKREEDFEKSEINCDSSSSINNVPNKVLCIRGLSQNITENDIRQEVVNGGLLPHDVRLIRKKTGVLCGYGFVEFSTVAEAIKFMEMTKGVFEIQKQKSILEYSRSLLNKAFPIDDIFSKNADWFCIKCCMQNFRRRQACYKCSSLRLESEIGGLGYTEECTYATKTIMLRNLDALTTEDSVMSVIKNVVPNLVKTISAVGIGRDPLTSTSRGICYLSFENTGDSIAFYGALTTPLTIDGKTAIISYCKYYNGDQSKPFIQESKFSTDTELNVNTMDNLNNLADYYASLYAKTISEYREYFQYYKMYLSQQTENPGQLTSYNEINSSNTAAQLAQNAIIQNNIIQPTDINSNAIVTQIPNGEDGKIYQTPEVDKYFYDKNTGYYYDVSTGLYYDKTSNYFYNSKIQKYLYWNPEKSTYLLVPTNTTVKESVTKTRAASKTTAKQQTIEKPIVAKNVAKKVAKDMARWAKNYNNKASLKKLNDTENRSSNKSADIGFYLLKKNSTVHHHMVNMFSPKKNETSQSKTMEDIVPTIDSDNSDEDTTEEVVQHLDWEKLICLLCKRKFFSKENLKLHLNVSALHKKNQELLYLSKSSVSVKTSEYRDRAKERREKYGYSDDPEPDNCKNQFLKTIKTPATIVNEPLATDNKLNNNKGNEMLYKMGWKEGEGLGKYNQGTVSAIQATGRVSTAGLGFKHYKRQPGDTYKDCVKKNMYIRYGNIQN